MTTLTTSTLEIIMFILFALILLVYIGGSLLSKTTVITSTPIKSNSLTTADLVYCLPLAAIQLQATATVVIVKNTASKLITSASLIEISFENTVSIIPDAEAVFALNYIPSGFMADEVTFSTDALGLLQNIATTTEDRLSNIITAISAVPAEILDPRLASAAFIAAEGAASNKTTETVQFTKTFNMLSSEVEAGKANRNWLLNIDGYVDDNKAQVDASFVVSIEKKGHEKFKPQQEAQAKPLPAIAYELKIPDSSRLINVLIKRSPFVKRVNTPKFLSGLLIENHICKPSEYEGLISIPVSIGKAIFSIPAQLFTFTIKNKDQQQIAELEIQKQLLQLKKDMMKEKGDKS